MHSRIQNIETILTNLQSSQKSYLSSTIGCVLDISRPLYRQKQNKYICEIKIIDQSFNKSCQVPCLIKQVSIFIFSEQKDQLNYIYRVGDFIYLHKFMFQLQDGIKIVAKFQGGIDCLFTIQSGQLDEIQQFQVVKKMGVDNPILDIAAFSTKIVQMKTWLIQQFLHLYNPFLGVKIVNNFCALIEPLRLILKLKTVQKNQYENIMILEDGQNNIFYLNISQFELFPIRKNNWVIIRGILKINTNYEINLTKTGNILYLPKIFAQEYHKLANYQAIYRKTTKIPKQIKRHHQLTQISVLDQKATLTKQLFDIQDSYRVCHKKSQIILPSYYLLYCNILSYTCKLHLYHQQYQMLLHPEYLAQISQQQKKQTINQRKITYLFEGWLRLTDRSVKSKKQILKVHLFTNQPKAKVFGDQIIQHLNKHIGHSNQAQLVKQAQQLTHLKLNKLIELSSFHSPVSLIIEPIKSDELIFRVVHTKIL